MTSVVLTFEGNLEDLPHAEQTLRRELPRVQLWHKAANLFEAELAPADLEWLMKVGVWKIHPMAYAEIVPPPIKLDGLSKRLAELRQRRTGGGRP